MLKGFESLPPSWEYVVDLAVAVVIGAAFGAIVTSLVNDIITPLILNPALKAARVDNIANLSWNGVAYGSFLSAVINFLVIGTVLFFVVKAAEKLKTLEKRRSCRRRSSCSNSRRVACRNPRLACKQIIIKRSDLLSRRSAFFVFHV